MYQIILNPVSGQRKARKNLRIVENVLKERNLSYAVHFSQGIRDAERIARELTSAGENEIIVLGGDGTLHEVLNGLLDPTLCRLGIVPSGTGNDFVESLGISKNVRQAIENIIDGEAKATDYIQVSDRRCLNVAGIGMDVDVLERCSRGKMKGKLKYLFSLLQSLFTFKGYPVVMECGENTERHDALIAAACNGTQFGGGIRICPTAVVDDRKLNVVLVECIGGKWKLIKALITLLKGKILSYPATTHFLCDRVVFRPDKPCTLQLDGELYTDIVFDAKICQGLKIYR